VFGFTVADPNGFAINHSITIVPDPELAALSVAVGAAGPGVPAFARPDGI